MHLCLRNDSLTFHPVYPLIRVFWPLLYTTQGVAAIMKQFSMVSALSRQMSKCLLVGNGLDKDNWGNRGTTLSLLSLLSNKYSRIDSIYSRQKNISSILPSQKFVHRLISKSNHILGTSFRAKKDPIHYDYNRLIEYLDSGQSKEWKIILEKLSQHNKVIINGEGDLIYSHIPRPTLLVLLAITRQALDMGSSVSFVNTISSADSNGYICKSTMNLTKSILADCANVSFRDKYSHDLMLPVIPGASQVPDALFMWSKYFDPAPHPINLTNLVGSYNKQFELAEKYLNNEMAFLYEDFQYVVVSGGSKACRIPQRAIPAYTALVNRLKDSGNNVILAQAAYADRFLEKVGEITNTHCIKPDISMLAASCLLRNATVLISGRYHPSVLASCAGTPCIFLKSNSHKTLSLQSLLDYSEIIEYNECPDEKDIDQICKKVTELSVGAFSLRSKLYAKSKELADCVESFYSSL